MCFAAGMLRAVRPRSECTTSATAHADFLPFSTRSVRNTLHCCRYVEGSEKAQEYFAGYLLEQSLSIDNLFVFVLVFKYFKTPPAAQPKV
jgi:hypothetical protein